MSYDETNNSFFPIFIDFHVSRGSFFLAWTLRPSQTKIFLDQATKVRWLGPSSATLRSGLHQATFVTHDPITIFVFPTLVLQVQKKASTCVKYLLSHLYGKFPGPGMTLPRFCKNSER